MRRRRGCRCRATSTSATKESGSTGGTPAATTESKKSSESVGVHESTSGSSSVVSRASPFTKKEGSGTAPLLELFFSPEILGNMNMQILWLRHDRGT